MSPYERIKHMTLDEMAEWFYAKFNNYYEAPWDEYLGEQFCNQCPVVYDANGDAYSYCDFEKCCPDGQRNVYNIDVIDLIKLWLAGDA